MKPTREEVLVPKWAGQFDSFVKWINHASIWLQSPSQQPAVCIDAKGRRCSTGKDFMRARDEGTFPVRYFWEFEVSASHECGSVLHMRDPFSTASMLINEWNEAPQDTDDWGNRAAAALGYLADQLHKEIIANLQSGISSLDRRPNDKTFADKSGTFADTSNCFIQTEQPSLSDARPDLFAIFEAGWGFFAALKGHVLDGRDVGRLTGCEFWPPALRDMRVGTDLHVGLTVDEATVRVKQEVKRRLDRLSAQRQDSNKDAERYRKAIAYEDNAGLLYCAVMNHCPDKAAIDAEFDAEAIDVGAIANGAQE